MICIRHARQLRRDHEVQPFVRKRLLLGFGGSVHTWSAAAGDRRAGLRLQCSVPRAPSLSPAWPKEPDAAVILAERTQYKKLRSFNKNRAVRQVDGFWPNEANAACGMLCASPESVRSPASGDSLVVAAQGLEPPGPAVWVWGLGTVRQLHVGLHERSARNYLPLRPRKTAGRLSRKARTPSA
jgi:hypothetical protein